MQKLVIAINTLSSQFWGVLTVMMGCLMMLLSKHYQISDSSIAAGIVGAGINMLTHDIVKASKDVGTPAAQPSGQRDGGEGPNG